MKLFYRELGSGQPILILHGLFGSSDNWFSIGRKLSHYYRVFLLDLRNHGRSPHSDRFDYDVMADDVLEFLDDHRIPEAVLIGHSLGGKVGMKISLLYPGRVRRLIVVDVSPGKYPPGHDTIFKALCKLDLSSLASRKDADAFLKNYIPEPRVRQFLLKNLYRKDDGTFGWKLNVKGIHKNLKAIYQELNTGGSFWRPTLFIKGGHSDYIRSQDEALIRNMFPEAEIVTIPATGHWVQAEAPQLLVNAVRDFLNDK